MADDMVQFCIELAKKHLEPIEKDWQAKGDEAVGAMKEALDAKYGPAWAVLAGKRWGASITHDQKHFINFMLGKDINVTVRGGCRWRGGAIVFFAGRTAQPSHNTHARPLLSARPPARVAADFPENRMRGLVLTEGGGGERPGEPAVTSDHWPVGGDGRGW
jgi:hypothetical protein